MEAAETTSLTLTTTDDTELFVGPAECDHTEKRTVKLPVFAKYSGNRRADLYCYLPKSASLAEQDAKLREICEKLNAEHAQFLAENE